MLLLDCGCSALAQRTSSVLGGKNSKEKNVLPEAMDALILSMIFMMLRLVLAAGLLNQRHWGGGQCGRGR